MTVKLFGHTPLGFWLTNLAIWIMAIPPLVMAYRAIANRRRWAWFLGFFTLPFVFVILFAGFFLENWLLLKEKFLATPILGIPYLILIVELLCLAIFAGFRSGISGRDDRAGRTIYVGAGS